MRFIRNEALEGANEALHRADGRADRDPAGRALGLQSLLGRLIDACEAMAHAQGRGSSTAT